MKPAYDILFFFQAEDGIRDGHVTGVQTCALPILGIEPKPVMIGATTTTRPHPAARSALVADRMPPSTQRRPLMVTGGQTPGTAQLAPTASTRDTPLSRSNARNSPDPASTAVISSRRSGQSRTGRRDSITARR